MAVKIRLRRMGQKKAPFYRIVVADSRSKRDGKCIAEIGTYDPNIEPSAYKVNEEEAKKWLAAGAQPTDVVARIFKEQQKGDCRYSAIITKRSCGDIAPFLKGVFYGRFIKSWRDHHDTRCTWRSQSLPSPR